MAFDSRKVLYDSFLSLFRNGQRVTSDDILTRRPNSEELIELQRLALPGLSRPIKSVIKVGHRSTGKHWFPQGACSIAQTRNLWLHIDAAYGGSVAFCRAHQSQIEDLGHADSIAWDAYKWLF